MLLALALLLAPTLQVSDLQPTTYTCPSGAYELFVNPSTPGGAGPAQCRLTRDGDEVWATELPFTFQNAVVTDNGTAAGFAFTGGRPTYAPNGEVVVAILSPAGKVRFEERVAMTPGTGSSHARPNPAVRGVLLQPELDRLILQVGLDDSWWVYDLSKAELHAKVEVKAGLAENDSLWSCDGGLAVPGTPLIVSHWLQPGGVRFVLLDERLSEIWSLDLPKDYRYARGADNPMYLVRDAGGALLEIGEHSFGLWEFAKELHRTFKVSRDEDAVGGWQVTEAEPRKYEPPAPTSQMEILELELPLLHEIQLQSNGNDQRAVRDIREFVARPDGGIQFIRDDGGHFTLVTLDSAGALTSERALQSIPFEDGLRPLWHPLPDGNWIMAHSTFDGPDQTHLLRFDANSGRSREIPAREFGRVESLDVCEDGIVICDQRGEYAPYPTITLLGFEGQPLWVVNADKRNQLIASDDVAVQNDGWCAAVSNTTGNIQFYNSSGIEEESVDLRAVLPTPPRYPSEIETDEDGGWLVHDFKGEPSTWRLEHDGTVRASFTPHFEGGRLEASLSRHLRRESDGRLWTTDGTALYQLDEAGLIVRTIGTGPLENTLTKPNLIKVDHLGRVLMQDGRTGAIHIFDRNGLQIGVGTYPESERKWLVGTGHLSVRDDGSFCISVGGHDVLEYSPSGAFRGKATSNAKRPRFQPGLGTAVVAGRRGFERVDSEGRTMKSISRYQDGSWMDYPDLEIGPAGAIAISGHIRGEGFQRVAWYDPAGEFVGSIRVPHSARGNPLLCERWLALQFYSPMVHLLNLEHRNLYRVQVGGPDEEKSEWRCGFSPEGDELWAISPKTLTLYRYALPEEGK